MARSAAPAKKRMTELAELLSRQENVSTSELAQHFGVSEMTIRRDLKQLEKSGLALSCYGGAVAARRITMEFNFDERHRTNLKQKERIGAAAADLVKDGQTLILDTGTTTLELARALAKRNIRVSIYTTSLVIASELWGKEHITLYLLGGQVRSGSPDLAGPLAEIVLERVTVDFAFLGSDGIDPQRGSFAADLETARISERMAVCAKRLVVIADSSKLGRPGAVRYAGFDQIDLLITDKAAPKEHLKTLKKRGVDVTCV